MTWAYNSNYGLISETLRRRRNGNSLCDIDSQTNVAEVEWEHRTQQQNKKSVVDVLGMFDPLK